jgi:hypothetical protein
MAEVNISAVPNPDNLNGFMLLGTPPEDTCQQCAVEHEPEVLHNRDSLYYQYWFKNKHGVWPTWRDAMSHCSDDTKEMIIKSFNQLGVDIDG